MNYRKYFIIKRKYVTSSIFHLPLSLSIYIYIYIYKYSSPICRDPISRG